MCGPANVATANTLLILFVTLTLTLLQHPQICTSADPLFTIELNSRVICCIHSAQAASVIHKKNQNSLFSNGDLRITYTRATTGRAGF